VAKFFDGDKEHGSSDDFLEELLLSSPAIKTDEGGKIGFVDPLRIAEDILRKRSKVATEWGVIAKNTKEEHINIRKVLLEKQMLKWGHRPVDSDNSSPAQPSPPSAAIPCVTMKAEVEIFGEFQ
jgi:hypothetical protein